MNRVVVVGASVAGIHVAESLRVGGFDGEVVVVGDEAVEPYDKPALSKEMLTGNWQPESLALLPGSLAAESNIELRLGCRAVHVDTDKQSLRLADSTEVGYDNLVIATGCHARRPPWAAGGGVLTLRTLADSQRLRETLLRTRRVVIVGGGFIGAEVCAAAAQFGCEVVVVDPVEAPLARMLGAEIGALLGDVHKRHGVLARYGTGVRSASGQLGDMHVELDDGTTLHADVVVAGVGAVPNDRWLDSSGLPVNDGVLCDEYCRVLGYENIYAAGDVARWQDARVGRAVRVEHWTNAVEQAGHVAMNILGDSPAPYRPLHYVWSDQYDWKLQFVSSSPARHHHVIMGDLAVDPPHGVVAFGDEEDKLSAVLCVNHPRALMNARRMLRTGWSFADAVRVLGESVSKPVA